MNIVRPMLIGNAQLSASDVPETDYAAYAAGAVYAAGDRVIVTAPAGTVTFTLGAPVLLNWPAHGQANGTLVVFSTTGALPTGIVAGRAYYLRDVATGSARLADSVNGTAISASGTQSGVHTATAFVHTVYESIQGANTGNAPAISATWWLVVERTNRWRMFDGSLTSQTANADAITVTLATTERVDTVVLLNVSAGSARVKMTDATDGVVYDQTHSLASAAGITDWWHYFFEPISRRADLVIDDLPPYFGATLEITLADAGEMVRCGACIVGLGREIGGTEYGAAVGIQDYSVKQRDDFGNWSVLERAFSKSARFSIELQNTQLDEVQRLLASYRATPVVYIGIGQYGATVIYGFYKDFSIVIRFLNHSVCSLDLEGLT